MLPFDSINDTLLQNFTWTVGVVVHLFLFCAVALHLMLHPRDPRATIAWLFFTWAVPILGAVSYLTLGINRAREKSWQKLHSDQTFRSSRDHHERVTQPLAYWRGIRAALLTQPTDVAAQSLNAFLDRIMPDHPLLGGNTVRPLVDASEAYPDIFAAIQNAKHHIHLQSYIIGADETGRKLMAALAERAAAGVQVRVLYDAFGSAHARLRGFFRHYSGHPNFWIVPFTQANFLKNQFQLNLRNHRKILVVDGVIGYTGGMNFYDVYLARPNHEPTHDYHFRVEGPAVMELQYSFLRDWFYMTDEDPRKLLAPCFFPPPTTTGHAPVRLLNNGPTASESETLMDAWFEAIVCARRQVLIVSPYFVPPNEIRRALRTAAMRGVDIKILVPAKSNHPHVDHASHALYESLLDSGVRIFELPPPMLHGKALLVDDGISFVGSANVDSRSLRLNYETNLVVLDETFTATMKQIVLADFARANEIEPAAWRARPIHRKIIENFCALMSPVF